MVDTMKRRELLRLSVRWPLAIRTDKGLANGETRNITGEGMFLYCSERLHEGVIYPMTLKLPEKSVEVAGKVTWSNLDSFTPLNFNPAMGFYFIRIDDDRDRESLRGAIVGHCEKLLRRRREAKRHTDSPLPGEELGIDVLEGIAPNADHPRN